jgi:hypothetical protein
MVNATDCYHKGAGFDFWVMHEFFPHVKEVEDIGQQTNLVKAAKHVLGIPKEAAF